MDKDESTFSVQYSSTKTIYQDMDDTSEWQTDMENSEKDVGMIRQKQSHQDTGLCCILDPLH